MPKSYSSQDTSSQYTKLQGNNIIKPCRMSYINALMKIIPNKAYLRSGRHLTGKPIVAFGTNKKITKNKFHNSESSLSEVKIPKCSPSFKRCRTRVLTRETKRLFNINQFRKKLFNNNQFLKRCYVFNNTNLFS